MSVGRLAVVAHRGASAFAPENTAASFAAGVAAGADLLETDVRLTADGIPLLLHDSTLARTTDAAVRFPDRAPWRVADFTTDELATLDAGAWFDPAFTGTRLLTLDALVSGFGERAGLLIELKPEDGNTVALVDAVARSLESASSPETRAVVVQSFDANCVQALAARLPNVRRLQLTAEPDDTTDAAITQIAEYADGLAVHHPLLDNALADRARAHRLTLAAWTVNAWDDQLRIATVACNRVSDAILITDDPASARRAAMAALAPRRREENRT